MTQHKGTIVAGVFAGLLIISLLALGIGGLGVVNGDTTTVLPETPPPTSDSAANAAAVEAWQQYSAELEQTLGTMLEREDAYQTQIDLANQTIGQLQDELNASESRSILADDEVGEHEEHEENERDDD